MWFSTWLKPMRQLWVSWKSSWFISIWKWSLIPLWSETSFKTRLTATPGFWGCVQTSASPSQNSLPLRKFTPRSELGVEAWIKSFLWVRVGFYRCRVVFYRCRVGFYRCRGLRCDGGSCWGSSPWPNATSPRLDGPEGRRDTPPECPARSRWIKTWKTKPEPSPGWKAHKARAQSSSPHPSSTPHGTFAGSSARAGREMPRGPSVLRALFTNQGTLPRLGHITPPRWWPALPQTHLRALFFLAGPATPGNPARCLSLAQRVARTENTRVFVSKILLKITPSLESWSWTPPPSTSFASLYPLCTAVAPIGT